MIDREAAVIESLTSIGISIAPGDRSGCGWKWSIANDKIIRDSTDAYNTPIEAAHAALNWLVEYARKGLLCQHTHPAPADDDLLAPWLRAFELGIGVVDDLTAN